jgi:5-methyltetrahydropteroyltriglutamate--homocysteine methyltransferase
VELQSANTGSYPRIGDRPEQQLHRQAYAQRELGEISGEEFERIQDEVTREVIEEQVKAGLDVVTDGQVRWYDPISHFARKLDGCEIDGLLRFFDTNFYFRQPVVKGELWWREPIVKREFSFAKEVSSKPVKPVVAGPYTLAKLSINRRGTTLSSLVDEFAVAIAQEVGELARAGAELIQVDEPAILKNPDDFKMLEAAIEKVAAEKSGAKLTLCTYFGDAAPLYKKLIRLPIDGLGLDFTYSPQLPNVIERLGCEKDLGLGLINGRNTRLEDEREVLAVIKTILPNVGSKRVYLTPSCGLGEYLPREIAFKKLQNMVAIAENAKELT